MLKTSIKWDPDYYKEQKLPKHGCFGFINGHLILGNTHHQMIMALILHSGWTFEQLMEAEQAWGWYELHNVKPKYDYDDSSYEGDVAHLPKYLHDSKYVSVRFNSDAGFQNTDAMQKVLGAFSQMYHLPAQKGGYGTTGISEEHNPEGYGSGLSGKQNLEHYLEKPQNYFQGENFRKYFPAGMPGQPPGSEWDPDWEKKFLEGEHDQQDVEIPGLHKPMVKGKKPKDFPVGSRVRVLNNRWEAGVNVGDIGTVKGYGPDSEDDGIAVVFNKDNEIPWYFHPNDLEKIPEPPAASAHLKQIAQEHFDKYGDHPLNGIYWTGSNFNIWGNGTSAWYTQDGIPTQGASPVAPDTVQKWIDQKQMKKVDHTPFKMSSGLNGTYDVLNKDTGEPNGLKFTYNEGITTFHYPNGSDGAPIKSLTPDIIKSWVDDGAVTKIDGFSSISSIWKEGYTPGGKTKGWGDIMEKANYIRQNNGVQILRNDPQHVVGQVQSGTDPSSKGPYQTEIWRDDPQSQAITMWDCDCDWDQYAWGRTRQWKKYEGRPCCHVLALYWDALAHPPQGAGGGEATPPTPTPGGGVTVNQGLIAPMGQPPMPNVPLIGPEGEPAPIGPEPAPTQAPWSEIVQPGKEEGTITFPGTFSHWKEAKVEIPDETREELNKFWHEHSDLRAECKKKYGFDPVDEADGYWPHGLGDEPEHHEIWDAVQDGPFTLELAKKWEKQELAAAKKESSAPTDPPNYRKADKPNEKCGTCKMFFKGRCWGYGNKPVEKDMVCDSFSPETKKEAAGKWWEQFNNQELPTNGTFGYINGHLILGGVHHKAIMSELLNAGWTWEQLMEAEQAWGWFAKNNLGGGNYRLNLKFVSDSGYQNDKAMEGAKQAFEEMYHLPVEVNPYVGQVEDEKGYGTGLGYQKALPKTQDWVGDVPPPPTASWKESAGYPWEDYQNWGPGQAEEHKDQRYITMRDGTEYKHGGLTHSQIIKENELNPADIVDAGYIMPNGEKYSFVDHENAYAPYLNNPDYGQPDPATAWTEASRKEAAFHNGDIVRVWEATQGYAQPAYGQPGYPVMIKKNQSGEVLSSDDEVTVVIFPLKTGPLEHHLVKVECPTSNLYLDNTNAQPFVKSH